VPVAQGRPNEWSPANQEALESLRAALANVSEAERYRWLAALLNDLADRPVGRPEPTELGQAEVLSRKLARLTEEKALADDALAAVRADLELRTRQLDAEQQRARDLDRIVQDQRARLKAAQDQISELEDQLVAKNAQLHQAENELEALRLKLQRAERVAGDTSRVDQMAEARRELERQLAQARAELEQLRQDKDAVIEELKGKLAETRTATADGGTAVLAALWDRLAQAKPPLVPGGQTPPVQAVERLFDAFLEFTRFTDDFDRSVNPFLTSFTKHNPAVAKPWEVYARSPDLTQVVREVIDTARGKPVGVLKMRLVGLKRWALAALLASDSCLESIAPALEEQLRGPLGMGADPNRKIRDYLRDDGPQLFHQQIRELRSQKLAEAYAHGV